MEPHSVEITDTGSWRLGHGRKLDVVVDSLFPRPLRFREVWKQVWGDNEDAMMQCCYSCAKETGLLSEGKRQGLS